MEDKNHTDTKESKRQLTKPKEDEENINFISRRDSLKAEHLLNDLTLNNMQKSCTLEWFHQLAEGHKTLNQTNLNYLESSRKQYSSFRKKLQHQLKNIYKNQASNQKLKKYFIENEYREFYNIIHNIQSLPSFLLTLDTFKTYTTCQIITHEKGNAYVSSNYFTPSGKSHVKRLDVDLFNKSFQSIKKSKSSYFSSSLFPSELTEVIGYFQAQSFSGNRYNLILILGRNDLLPPNQEECETFNKVTEHLNPVLNAILLRSGKDDKNLNIIDLLETLPLPFCIRDKSESFLFKNTAFDKFNELLDKNYEKVEHTLTGKNTFCLYFDKSLKEEADVYHFYRVTLLGELLNTLKHELSNPLFGLSLASDMLDTTNKDQEIQETILDIKSNSTRCQTIIKSFSSLYEEEEHFKDFDLIQIINETLTLTKSETRGIKKVFKNNDQPIIIYSNPTWISQIIFNLIINSAQVLKDKYKNHLRNAEISISISIQKTSILIHIRDNGHGVPEVLQDKLFRPFFTTKESGTGLGLSICKNLIQKLDGSINYCNRSNGGAQFSLSLPLEKI